MNKMKKILLFTVLPFLTLTGFAQNMGADFFLMGEFGAAKEYFNKQLTQNPEESNFYLGEIAFLEGKVDEAKAFYEKGLAAAPESAMNTIGLTKLTIKSDPKGSADIFKNLSKKNKKNELLHLLMARAYFDVGDLKSANEYLEKTRKINKKYPPLYILQGDLVVKEDPGKAGSFYDQAIYFDANYILGYIKSAKVYVKINNALAVDKLEKAIELNPDYMFAYKYLGEASIEGSRFEQAGAAYEKYFSSGNYSVGDITNYSSVLNTLKKYDESLALIQEGLKREPDNYILHRLWLYNLLELKDYTQGLTVAEKFFAIQNERPHIPKDFIAYGKMLEENKQYDKALENYLKAEEAAKEDERFKTSLPGIYADIASLYKAEKNMVKAAEFQEKFMATAEEADKNMGHYYELGTIYSSLAASLDSASVEDPSQLMVLKQEYVAKADSTFSVLIETLPDNPMGYQGKARAYSALDPEVTEGTAKPYYEKLLEILLAQGDKVSKPALLETYTYLGYYYFLKEDKDNSVPYWEKVLELKPNDANANAILEQWK